MFEVTPEIQEKLAQLQEKYAAIGQDMPAYLDGLLYSNSLTYWDYIHLDTLLSLQKPRTDYPDEVIFITYHQITELYFKLIQVELDQVTLAGQFDLQDTLLRLQRVNNYFRHLASSFDVMTYGMDRQQFQRFRMALLPASGFQTVQYREIEIKLTGLYQLTDASARERHTSTDSLVSLFEHIYWRSGGIELSSGKKTLTLKMFEREYGDHLLNLARQMERRNLRALYLSLPKEYREKPELVTQLKDLDLNANVFWRLSHYRSAARYLQRDPEVLAATGGTNWQQYLPPRFQRIIFYPELWTKEEIDEWGKAWVLKLFADRVEKGWSQGLKAIQGSTYTDV